MHDQSATPKPLVDELPELKDWGRDLRIDACRGIALWWIFLDHIPNNIGSWLTPRNYGFSDAAEVFMFVSGVTCALAYGKAWRCEGWTGVIGRTLRRSWDIYVAFLLLTLASAILVHLAGGGLFADDEQYAHSAGSAGRDARARGDLAIPSSQYRRVADLRASSPLVRAAAVAAAASAERDAWRLAGALCAGACLRLDRPGVAEQPLGLQSDGLAVAGCAWRVVDDRGQQGPAVGEVTHGACSCRPLSALQPGHRIELAHQTAGSTDPADAGDICSTHWTNRISIPCDCCIFWPWPFWRHGWFLATGER